MSLIPSESASFPDLIGHVHGYRHPNASRPSVKRGPPPAPARISSPSLATNPEGNPATPNVRDEVRRADDSSQPAEQIIAGEKASVQTSPLVRAALPILPQRTVAQMRSKIQPQETPPPVPANRPRSPVRGLTIARPVPVAVEKPTHQLSARFPLISLPRHRLVKLIGFIVCETLAVGVLVLAMMFGFAHQFANDPFSLVLKVLAVVAAAAAILVPVIFYGLAEIFPRSQR
jgi:hypothetical protein